MQLYYNGVLPFYIFLVYLIRNKGRAMGNEMQQMPPGHAIFLPFIK